MVIKLSEPIYNSTLTVFYNISKEDGKKAIEKLTKKTLHFEEGWDGVFHSEGNNGYIWIRSFDNNVEDIGLLSHELMHFTFNVLGWAGMRATPESDEAYTYFFQYYQVKLLKKMLRLKDED